MSDVATTKMSTRGQIVIPEAIRKRMGLEPGVEFVVVGHGDAIVLKAIRPPSMREFDGVMARAREAAKRARMKRSDIATAIAAARSR
jgi:AbrB family looped-hinge helix DNA binding protein